VVAESPDKSKPLFFTLPAGFDRDEWNARPDDSPHFKDESLHFYPCATCGQAVDRRRLGDVLYHEQPVHKSLPVT
jgi:hypothetical protein